MIQNERMCDQIALMSMLMRAESVGSSVNPDFRCISCERETKAESVMSRLAGRQVEEAGRRSAAPKGVRRRSRARIATGRPKLTGLVIVFPAGLRRLSRDGSGGSCRCPAHRACEWAVVKRLAGYLES